MNKKQSNIKGKPYEIWWTGISAVRYIRSYSDRAKCLRAVIRDVRKGPLKKRNLWMWDTITGEMYITED